MGIVQVQPSAGANLMYHYPLQGGDEDVSVEHHLAMCLLKSPYKNMISLVPLGCQWHEGPSHKN